MAKAPKRLARFRPKRAKLKYLPVFVYGTLRNGQGNYYGILEGYTEKEVMGTLKATLHMVNNYGFPGILHGDGIVVGELMYILPDWYDLTMEDLDRLEANGFMYDREEVTVIDTDGNEVQAWTYFYKRTESLGGVIKHGDFLRYCKDMRSKGSSKK